MRAFVNESVETYAETPEASGPTASSETSLHDESAQSSTLRADDSTPEAVRPTNAARDEARLLLQSPIKLFFYWNLARDPRPALHAALGDAATQFHRAVRLVEADGVWEGDPSAADDQENSFWFDALPGRTYRAEFGFHAAGLPFVRVLSSNAVETPAAGVSAESDTAQEFRIGEHEFAQVLEVSGYTHARRRASSGTLAAHTDAPGDSELPSSSSLATPPTPRADIF